MAGSAEDKEKLLAFIRTSALYRFVLGLEDGGLAPVVEIRDPGIADYIPGAAQ